MKYIDERNGEVKETDYLQLVSGESKYRIEYDNKDRIVITKVDFENDRISIQPMVRNQILIK